METDRELKLQNAKKRVEQIKGFYSHLTVYILVNFFIIAASAGVWDALFQNQTIDFNRWFSWNVFITPFFWGIGLAAHAAWVFGKRFTFLKNWEERKIKEFMEKE